MADLAYTKAQIAPCFPDLAEINSMVAAVTIEAGQTIYTDSNGKAALGDGSAAGTAKAHGVALNDAGAGQAVDVLRRGHVYGYTITQAYNATVYISDTAGSLADAAGTNTKEMGFVEALSDSDLTKVLFISAR